MPRPLVWCGLTFAPTGYADELRGMVAALEAVRQPVCLRTNAVDSPGFRDTLAADHRALLERSIARPINGPFLQLQHSPVDLLNPPHEQAVYSIGRSMFETDSLPSNWVSSANMLDELWVPGEFNRQTFRDAGVRIPLHMIPGGIDSKMYRPGIAPLVLPGTRGTVFLSVFEWRMNKGWDVLLRAWADAFSPDEDVTLVLRTYPKSQVDGLRNAEVIDERINTFLREQCGGRTRADVARIIVLGERIAARDLPALYSMAHAFVLPTRGEGWGRPFMESMACGVPVIATNWSAHLAFMNEQNSYLVDTDGLVPADSSDVAYYANQRWANPSVTHLSTQMRRVHADRTEARAIGARARADMVNEWPWSRAAAAISARLLDINGTLNRIFAVSVEVSPAIVVAGGDLTPAAAPSNASSWMQALLARDGMEAAPLSWRPRRCGARPSYGSAQFLLWQRINAPVAGTAMQISVLDETAHTFAPTPPAEGHWLIDVGSVVTTGVPLHLVTLVRDQADLVVVPHAVARGACLDIGVDDARIVAIPPAIDVDRFTPTGAAYRHSSTAGTRFLLIGGDQPHRALQHVVAAYDRAFTANDDVIMHLVLPVPVDGDATSWRARIIREAKKGTRHPRLPRLWVDTPPILFDEMPALYRSCDVFIHAGSATGRGQTMREAMACGIPVIATATAPADELLDDFSGWLITPDSSGCAEGDALQRALREATSVSVRQARGAAARARSLTQPAIQQYHDALHATVQRCATNDPRARVGDASPPFVSPFLLDGARRVVVLAHADWRSGMAPAIVRVYAATCSATDDVTLALCLDPAQGLSEWEVSEFVAEAVRVAGRSEDDAPDIILIPDYLNSATLHRLYAAADIVIAVRDTVTAATARCAGRDVVTSLNGEEWRTALACCIAREAVS